MSWKVFARHTDVECIKCGYKSNLLDMPVDDKCIMYCPECGANNRGNFKSEYHPYKGGQ